MSQSIFIYGIHTIQSLLENNPHRIIALWINQERKDSRLQHLETLARQAEISPQFMSRQVMTEKVGNVVHQGVVAQISKPPNLQEADLYELLRNPTSAPLLLVLDGVQDPQNLGACLRSANAAGANALIIPKDKSVTITPTVYKAAAGAAEITPIIQVTNLANTLRKLQEQGIWIYGTSDQAKTSLYETDLKSGIAFVLGAEGKGLRRLTAEHCDVMVSIPMYGSVASLNVSVASGICLFEAQRQRMSHMTLPT